MGRYIPDELVCDGGQHLQFSATILYELSRRLISESSAYPLKLSKETMGSTQRESQLKRLQLWSAETDEASVHLHGNVMLIRTTEFVLHDVRLTPRVSTGETAAHKVVPRLQRASRWSLTDAWREKEVR